VKATDERRSVAYFFLSYAHTAPLAGAQRAPTDHWVAALFNDLSTSVRESARLRHDAPVGFFDGELPAGSDWKTHTSQELGKAEVFVPLFSRGYFAMSWPGREWTCFSTRLTALNQADAARHVAPILWTPLSRSQALPRGADPLRLGAAKPEYAENGLRALNMVALYRDSYEAIVTELGREIVRVTHNHPLGPSTVPPLDQVPSAFRHNGEAGDDFAVTVAAPTLGAIPAGRDPRGYGAKSTDWRPFGEREELRLAEHAVTAAERLDFRTVASEIGEALRSDTAKPGVVLIDPWIVESRDATGDLDALLELFAGGRERWTLPLVVHDEHDPQAKQAARLVEVLGRILAKAGALSTETARRGALGVRSIEDFAAILPVMVTEAERQFLKHSPDFERTVARPRPGGLRPTPPEEKRERPHD
jgi:FxsC-like protein